MATILPPICGQLTGTLAQYATACHHQQLLVGPRAGVSVFMSGSPIPICGQPTGTHEHWVAACFHQRALLEFLASTLKHHPSGPIPGEPTMEHTVSLADLLRVPIAPARRLARAPQLNVARAPQLNMAEVIAAVFAILEEQEFLP